MWMYPFAFTFTLRKSLYRRENLFLKALIVFAIIGAISRKKIKKAMLKNEYTVLMSFLHEIKNDTKQKKSNK